MVGDKFKRPRICWAATCAALVSRPGGEDSVAVDNRPPSRPNPSWRVAEALHYIGMLSECLRKVFQPSSPRLLETFNEDDANLLSACPGLLRGTQTCQMFPENVCTIQNASENASGTPCLVACLLLLNSMVRKEKQLSFAVSTPYKR